MELESALPPPNIRLNHSNRHYMLRALKLSDSHPIRVEVTKAFEKISESLENDDQIQDFRPESQIENLAKSIYSLVDIASLEPIVHYYFAS